MEFFKSHKTYDFMSQRKWWIALSIILSVGSLISLYFPGPNYGTDFRGGTEIEVAFSKPTDGGQIREAIVHSGQFSEPDVVKVQSPTSESQFLIRVQEISTVDDATKEQIKKALCFGIEGEGSAACPKNAQATEVKFSAGGDKLSVRYDVEPDLAKIKAQVQTGQRVIIGMRPEAAQLITNNMPAADGLRLRGIVDVIEPDFARRTQLLYLRSGAFTYAAVVPIDVPLGIGHTVEVLFPTEQLHFFDEISERRIG